MAFSINDVDSIRYTYLENKHYPYSILYSQKMILDPMRYLNRKNKTIKVLENNMRVVVTRAA